MGYKWLLGWAERVRKRGEATIQMFNIGWRWVALFAALASHDNYISVHTNAMKLVLSIYIGIDTNVKQCHPYIIVSADTNAKQSLHYIYIYVGVDINVERPFYRSTSKSTSTSMQMSSDIFVVLYLYYCLIFCRYFFSSFIIATHDTISSLKI